MNLEELQTARDRERQTDQLQQLRESFYADAGAFIQQLRTERARAAEQVPDPFDSPEVNRLTDQINTAEQSVEAIYEKRVGKIVKAASFAAADLPAEAEGMTTEEQELFETLVAEIKGNRQQVLDVLAGESNDSTADTAPSDGPADNAGISAADLMGPGAQSPEPPEANMPGETGGQNVDTTNDTVDPDGSGSDEAVNQDDSGSDGTVDQDGSQEKTSDDDIGGSKERNETKDGEPGETNGTEGGVPGETNETEGGEPGETIETEDGDGNETVGSNDDSSNGTHRSAREDTGGVGDEGDDGEQLRNDGGPTASQSPPAGTDGATEASDSIAGESTGTAEDSKLERRRVRITQDIDQFVGADDREYDLDADDVVTLPDVNATLLVERDVAKDL